jgi:hypothetical protein
MEELLLEGHEREDVMDIILERDWQFILMACPWLVPIQREDINEKDRVIAYRLMLEDVEPTEFDPDINTDFHFRVLIDGEWWEKNGAGPVHKVENPDDDEDWVVDDWLVYDGEIRYAKFVK